MKRAQDDGKYPAFVFVEQIFRVQVSDRLYSVVKQTTNR